MTESLEDHAAVVNDRISVHEQSLAVDRSAERPAPERPATAAMALPALPARDHLAPGALATESATPAKPPMSEEFYSRRMQAGFAAALFLVLTLVWILERRARRR